MLNRVLIEKPMVEQSRGSRQQVREASLLWRGVQGAGGSLRTEWRLDWGKRDADSGGAPWEGACCGDGDPGVVEAERGKLSHG